MNHLVSVIIPTYKRSELLPRAIESVLQQTFFNVQVVVIDDNDPDSEYRRLTEVRMKAYEQNDKVKYVRHTQNCNGSVARNTGIQNSDGDIVTFLDDDDIYLPTKVEKQVLFLLNHPEYRAVYCGWNRKFDVLPSHEGNLSYDLLSGDNIIYTNAIMMWKNDAIQCGGWDETFVRHQEAAFLLRYFKNGGLIGVVPEALIFFDVSDRSNETSDPQKNEYQVLHLLNTFDDVVKGCDFLQKGDGKKIRSHRYRGILLKYLKECDFRKAALFYLRKMCEMPVRFNMDLAVYAMKRLLKKR